MRRFFPLLFLTCFFLQACSDNTHTYQGYVASTKTYLSSSFSGRMQKFLVKKGDKVEKNDLLYVLDPEPQIFTLNETKALYRQGISNLEDLKKPKREPALDAIKAKITQIESQITLAELRVKRNQTLYDKKVLAKDSLDASIENLHQLEAHKKQTQADLELAKLGARSDVINAQSANVRSLESKIKSLEWIISEKKGYAPDNAYVYDTYFVVGEIVNKTQPVIALINPKNIYLEFYIPFQEIKSLHIGDKAFYAYMGDKAKHVAKITYIAQEAEYVPPLVYSSDNMDKLVFKVKAVPVKQDVDLISGLPVTITVDKSHG